MRFVITAFAFLQFFWIDNAQATGTLAIKALLTFIGVLCGEVSSQQEQVSLVALNIQDFEIQDTQLEEIDESRRHFERTLRKMKEISLFDNHRFKDHSNLIHSMDHTAEAKAHIFEEHFPNLVTAKVCEVGCGSGWPLALLAGRRPQWTFVGVDYSSEMIEHASSKHSLPNLKFTVGELHHPALKDCDVLISSSVLHEIFSFAPHNHIQSLKNSIEESAQALKPGGLFLVRDFMGPSDPNVEVQLVQKKAYRVEGKTFLDFVEGFRLNHGYRTSYEIIAENEEISVYQTSLRDAMEYLYRYPNDHWKAELMEIYFFWSEVEVAEAFEFGGLELTYFQRLPNQHKTTELEGKIHLVDPQTGKTLNYPQDKAFFIGQKRIN